MCGPLLAAFPALGGVAGAGTAASTIGSVLGIASSLAGAMGQNRAITEQQRQLAAQSTREYSENAMRRFQADRNAAQEGYQAAREADIATGRAVVRNTSLGISGTTAGELVREEIRAGSYNVASAIEQSRDARGAELMSNNNTFANVSERSAALDSQRPGIVTTLFGMATGGLEGYMLGDRVDVARGTKR